MLMTSETKNFTAENVGAFFDLFQGFAFSCSADRKILSMNQKLKAFIEEGMADGKFCYDILFGLDKPCSWCPEEAMLRGECTARDILSPKDGKWYRTIQSPVISPDGAAKIVLCWDVTGEKEALQDRDIFSFLLSQASDAIFLVDAVTSRVIYANEAACRHLGYTAEELTKLRVIDFGENVQDLKSWDELQLQLLRTGDVYIETRQRRRDSSTIPVEIHVRRVTFHDRDYCVSIVRDISDRIRVKSAMIEEKNKLEAVLKGLTDGVMMVDRDLCIVFQNQVHRQKQGDHAGELCYRAFHKREVPCPECQVIMGFEDGRAHRRETVAESEDKNIFLEAMATPVRDASGEIIGAIEVVRDITEQKKIEEELAKGQRFESLALLAGGIAHDFNNLLAVMLANISLALHVNANREVEGVLQEAEKANLRCRQITEQLLTFSKHGSLHLTSASVVDLVREASDFILHGTTIACTCDLADDLWPVRVDEGQISQVLTNILINAREALPKQGAISIRAANVEVAESSDFALTPGRYAHISIHNDGEPIPAEILPRIFDPYFTTKKTGSGLGLATAYSIVRKHGGEITVDSKPFSGTTFHILLPATNETTASRNAEKKIVTPPCKGGRVLVMDDESAVLLAVRAMLRYLGFETVGCSDGDEAVAEYAKAIDAGDRFDTVILDLTVKGGTGGETALQRIKTLDPKAVAIVSTGYSEVALDSMDGWAGKLKKPFTIEELSAAIDRAHPSAGKS
ncbi:MAG: hypothetical protein CXR31_07920 [Geobacter sp.]|nr:MAG: hypothetical protein CXR31_07920 [Geobacter sp.]